MTATSFGTCASGMLLLERCKRWMHKRMVYLL
jgi:hypothetical protein